MMTRSLIAWFTLIAVCTAAEPDTDLFKEVESLAKRNQKAEAMAKADQALAQFEKSYTGEGRIRRSVMDGLRRASQLAREDFLDYDKSLFFCGKMLQYADSDYWRVPARLEMALTYRAMGEWDKAQKEYDAIAQGDERQRARMLLPQAEMVYFGLGDRQRGRKLLEEALRNEDVNDRERYGAVMKLAQRAVADGRRDEAIRWYAMLETLPAEKPAERDSFLTQAWYETGRIEESRGRMAEAKALYRKAMSLEDGNMRHRVRARDALEDIGYFE